MRNSLDLVMWVKDGTYTLSEVLVNLNRFIPEEKVNQKIVVDDGSKDLSQAIARQFGWKVIKNEGKGISDAANTALKYVETESFCSFEQDVLVSPDWCNTIPKMLGGKVVVASGVRLPYPSKVLRAITLFEVERTKCDLLDLYMPIHHCFGMSLDNTCYNTEFMKEIGGFPNVPSGAGVDRLLAEKVLKKGFEWSINYDVQSNHIRKGIRDELKHYYWYGKCQNQIDNSFRAYLGLSCRALFCPIRGLDIAIKQKNPSCVFVYPAIRFSSLAGALREKL
jgi:glycosyltransferase involved in cell wall biosynthesis